MPAPLAHVFQQCTRGARTHGDVLNVHTEVFRKDTTEKRGGGHSPGKDIAFFNRENKQKLTFLEHLDRRFISYRQFSAHREWPSWGYHVLQRFTERNAWILPISSLRTVREQHVPDSSNHSLARQDETRLDGQDRCTHQCMHTYTMHIQIRILVHMHKARPPDNNGPPSLCQIK